MIPTVCDIDVSESKRACVILEDSRAHTVEEGPIALESLDTARLCIDHYGAIHVCRRPSANGDHTKCYDGDVAYWNAHPPWQHPYQREMLLAFQEQRLQANEEERARRHEALYRPAHLDNN
jgi:hypothetical protein